MMHEINEATCTTFVLVTHDADVGGACDRVVSMLDGVVEDADGDDGTGADGDAGNEG